MNLYVSRFLNIEINESYLNAIYEGLEVNGPALFVFALALLLKAHSRGRYLALHRALYRELAKA